MDIIAMFICLFTHFSVSRPEFIEITKFSTHKYSVVWRTQIRINDGNNNNNVGTNLWTKNVATYQMGAHQKQRQILKWTTYAGTHTHIHIHSFSYYLVLKTINANPPIISSTQIICFCLVWLKWQHRRVDGRRGKRYLAVKKSKNGILTWIWKLKAQILICLFSGLQFSSAGRDSVPLGVVQQFYRDFRIRQQQSWFRFLSMWGKNWGGKSHRLN